MRVTPRICHAQDLENLKQTEAVVAAANEVGHSSVGAVLPVPLLVGAEAEPSVPSVQVSSHSHYMIALPSPMASVDDNRNIQGC